jgi:hypothetical protein
LDAKSSVASGGDTGTLVSHGGCVMVLETAGLVVVLLFFSVLAARAFFLPFFFLLPAPAVLVFLGTGLMVVHTPLRIAMVR